jgi:hypothetical protein
MDPISTNPFAVMTFIVAPAIPFKSKANSACG